MPDAAATSLPDPASFLLDAQGLLLECGERTRALLGLDQGDEHAMLALCPEAQPDGTPSAQAWRMREGSARGGLPQCFSWQFRRHDGTPVDVLVELELDRAGGYLAGRLRDLTVLRSAERALRDSQARLQQIVDHTSAAVFVKGLDGRYLWVNREFARITGRSADEIAGHRDDELFPTDAVRKFRAHDARVLESRQSIDTEEHIVVDGSERTYLKHKFPLLAADGRPHAICGISTDITARKRVEDALRAAALAVSSAEGEDIFHELVRFLATILDADAAFVAEFTDDSQQMLRMLAVLVDGRFLRQFEYPVVGSPCAKVVGRAFHFVASGVHGEFPPGTIFAAKGFDSYAALPLLDGAGRQLGLVAAMSRRPMTDPGMAESMLKIFATRAAAELERRRAVEALAESEASYRAIFEASADAIFVHDWDTGRILDVSRAAEKFYGWSTEDLKRLSVEDISAADEGYTQEKALEQLERAKAGENIRFEWRVRHRSGVKSWHEVRIKPAMIAGKKRLLAYTRDINATKAAEEALRDSEAQYRAIFNAAADALILWDSRYRRVDVNPAYEQMYGWTRDDVVGRGYDEPEYSADYARPRQELLRRALAGETARAELEAVRKDGRRILTEVVTIPFRHRGEPHVLAIARDITERKRHEEALRDSEEQYRAIFNASADALMLWNSHLQRVDVNPAHEKIFGYSREDVIGRSFEGLGYPEELVRPRMDMLRRALAGEAGRAELEALRKDGQPIVTELRAIPYMHRGEPHVLQVARDITDRRRAEEERAKLEHQLRQAQKMEALGHLTGGIAHDFNNLLTSILGYIALSSEREATAADPRLARYLEQARASCGRARDLIQQMLTFSRPRRGERRALALAPLVGEAVKLLRASFPASVALETELDAQASAVMVDPVQLDQVLMNLAINARDAMDGAGRIVVRVAAARHDAAECASCRKQCSGDFVALEVRDDGPGITPAVRERMFEPFFSTKAVGRGTGMGLATVHGIVHDLGGHVLVASEPGRGTTFTVLLPALDRAPDATAEHRTPERERTPPLAGRVLVVEDVEAVAAFMRDLLQTWSLEVTVVTDPVAALELFRADPTAFDVVITDQAMPSMTGLALAAQLAQLRPALPILLYTGYGEGITPVMLATAGVRQLLAKPVEPATAYAALAACLSPAMPA